jgi:hypothetical protein
MTEEIPTIPLGDALTREVISALIKAGLSICPWCKNTFDHSKAELYGEDWVCPDCHKIEQLRFRHLERILLGKKDDCKFLGV